MRSQSSFFVASNESLLVRASLFFRFLLFVPSIRCIFLTHFFAETESLARALGRLAQLNQSKVYLFWKKQYFGF